MVSQMSTKTSTGRSTAPEHRGAGVCCTVCSAVRYQKTLPDWHSRCDNVHNGLKFAYNIFLWGGGFISHSYPVHPHHGLFNTALSMDVSENRVPQKPWSFVSQSLECPANV